MYSIQSETPSKIIKFLKAVFILWEGIKDPVGEEECGVALGRGYFAALLTG